MDNLSVSDKHHDKKYEDMQVRLDMFKKGFENSRYSVLADV